MKKIIKNWLDKTLPPCDYNGCKEPSTGILTTFGGLCRYYCKIHVDVMRIEIDNQPTKENEDIFYIKMAQRVSSKSSCFRSKCGAVIVHLNKVLVSDYNHPPINQPDCGKIGSCYRDVNNIKSGTEPDKCRSFGCHAESNAVSTAAREGIATKNSTIYIFGNTEICPACKGSITNAGIVMVVYQTKHGVIAKINVGYDWSIHPLDQKRKFEEWKSNV